MNVIEMLQAKLREIDADGLANDECGCLIDDLAPAGCLSENCVAAARYQSDTAEYDFIMKPLRKDQ